MFVVREQTFIYGLYNYRKGVCVCLRWTVTQHLVDDHNPNSKMKSYMFWCEIEMHIIFHFTVFCCGFWMLAQQDCEKWAFAVRYSTGRFFIKKQCLPLQQAKEVWWPPWRQCDVWLYLQSAPTQKSLSKTKSTGAPVEWMSALRKLKCCSVWHLNPPPRRSAKQQFAQVLWG